MCPRVNKSAFPHLLAIPDANGLVVGASRQILGVRRPRHRIDSLLMSLQDELTGVLFRFVDTNCLVGSYNLSADSKYEYTISPASSRLESMLRTIWARDVATQ